MKFEPQLANPFNGDTKSLVMEPKYDGIRIIAQKIDGKLDIYTRTLNSQLGKLPNIEAALNSIDMDFVLDGEIVAVTDVKVIGDQVVPFSDFTGINSIIGSGPAKAIQKQTKEDNVAFVVFDFLQVGDKNLLKIPDIMRRQIGQSLVEAINDKHILLTPRWSKYDESILDEIIANGGEGVMLKNPLAPYSCGKRPTNVWFKIKNVATADVVIMGYKPGQGSYTGMIGAVEFGQYRDGKLIPRSRCSGMDMKMRKEFSERGEEYIGRVMEIKFFGRTGPERSFRNPNFIAVRVDKEPQDCVWE